VYANIRLGHSDNFRRGLDDGASASAGCVFPHRSRGHNYIDNIQEYYRRIQFTLLANCVNLGKPDNTLTTQGICV